MTSTTANRPAPDGTRLLTRHWAAVGAPWAAMMIVHGLGEHSGRYEHVGDVFAAAGIDVHAYDLRGFGASGGRRAWVARWSDLHDDLETMLGDVRAVTAGPVVLYGHSLGGLVAAGYVLGGRPPPDLLVLSAPGIDDELAPWKHAATAILDRLAPGLRLANGVDRDHLASGMLDAARYEGDPLVQTTTTAHFGRAGFVEQARVRAALARLDRMPVPTLVFRGSDDPLVPGRTVTRFAGLGEVTTRTYPGLRHETHNEPTGGAVLEDVVAWIRERAGAIRPARATTAAEPTSTPDDALGAQAPTVAPVDASV